MLWFRTNFNFPLKLEFKTWLMAGHGTILGECLFHNLKQEPGSFMRADIASIWGSRWEESSRKTACDSRPEPTQPPARSSGPCFRSPVTTLLLVCPLQLRQRGKCTAQLSPRGQESFWGMAPERQHAISPAWAGAAPQFPFCGSVTKGSSCCTQNNQHSLAPSFVYSFSLCSLFQQFLGHLLWERLVQALGAPQWDKFLPSSGLSPQGDTVSTQTGHMRWPRPPCTREGQLGPSSVPPKQTPGQGLRHRKQMRPDCPNHGWGSGGLSTRLCPRGTQLHTLGLPCTGARDKAMWWGPGYVSMSTSAQSPCSGREGRGPGNRGIRVWPLSRDLEGLRTSLWVSQEERSLSLGQDHAARSEWTGGGRGTGSDVSRTLAPSGREDRRTGFG